MVTATSILTLTKGVTSIETGCTKKHSKVGLMRRMPFEGFYLTQNSSFSSSRTSNIYPVYVYSYNYSREDEEIYKVWN